MFDSLCRFATSGAARILMYHRFSVQPQHRRLDAAGFEGQIQFICRHFEPSHLSALVDKMRTGKSLPPNQVVLTVDDGYADFLEVAYPILQKYRVPATIYVVSEFANQNIWLWFDALRYCLTRARGDRYQLEIGGSLHEIVLDGGETRESAWHRLGDAWLRLTPTDRASALSRLQATLEEPLPARPVDEFRAMTWDELRRLDPALVHVGSHTCTHPTLSSCSVREIQRELAESKATIERELSQPVRTFSYPNGQRDDFNATAIAGVQAAGYESAVVAYGSLVRATSNLLLLERMEPHIEPSSFRIFVNGYPHLVDRTRELFRQSAL